MRTWTVDDVMTTAVVSVEQTASYRSLVDLLIEHRFSAVPVVDPYLHVTGVVSETDLLRKIEYAGDEEPRLFEGRRRRGDRGKARAQTAAELMSTPPIVVRSGTPIAAAARLMDAESVKRLPVVDQLGRLVGIVSRGDLLKVHLRPDDDIRAEVETGVLPTVPDLGEAVSVAVDAGRVTLTGRVARASTADLVDRLTRQVAGVVAVDNTLEYEFDDRTTTGVGVIYGLA